MTRTHVFIIAAALLALSGCVRRETQASRDFLDCVYHQQYDLGLARTNAEARCR